MKIRIRKDARQAYINLTAISYRQNVNYDWADKMGQIAGMTLDVETDFLFRDQFNTAPIPGVSDNGLRIMSNMVEEVIDDERPGKMRCQWCGKTSDKSTVCPSCGRYEYLEYFTNEKEHA